MGRTMRRRLQTYRLRRWFAVPCAVLLSLALFVPRPANTTADAPPSDWQATMRDIFQALITVFPVSLDAQQFQDPAQHPRLLAALRTLAQHAGGWVKVFADCMMGGKRCTDV